MKKIKTSFGEFLFIPGEKIWIDDLREAPVGFRRCCNYEQAIATLNYFSTCEGGIDLVCFDHDLGEEKSGYDIAKYIVKHQIPIDTFIIQSMNPVGANNIRQLLTHYGYIESPLTYLTF